MSYCFAADCLRSGPDNKRCSGCREAHYCSASHQKADWSRHKTRCKYVRDNPKSIWIQVEAREGNGLGNKMVDHWFDNKEAGMAHVLQHYPEFANGGCCGPLGSAFCEILGWNVEIYHIRPRAGSTLNGAGVFLTCDMETGLSPFHFLSGRIFVTGRNQKGESMTSDILWGILNFIWDTMDYYLEGSATAMRVIARWIDGYLQGSWTPQGGSGGIDVYCLDPRQCRTGRMNDHCN